MSKKKLTKQGQLFIIVAIFIAGLSGYGYFHFFHKTENKIDQFTYDGLTIDYDYLTPNKYSRPQKALPEVKGVVIHYTANPGSSAKNNRDYFQSLRKTHITKASSHFVIGLKGEIIQCIPLKEISYASNNRNKDTISIECCHPDKTGKFNANTYDALLRLTRALMDTYDLDKDDIIRHYDVTGKLCPLYYVKNPEAWTAFKDAL